MPKQISFLIKILIIFLVHTSNNFAVELTIIPLKKPILDKAVTDQKITKGILKPKSKPKKDNSEEKTEKIIVVNKKDKKIKFLLPKSKPLMVKKEVVRKHKKSKYFKQKDFNLARKSILAFEKGQWTKALSLSKKTKNKSIYTFVQWKHLLTTGNQASFYDYDLFIKQNENYPRINRIKYLAEHKMSTTKISPKKIIDWFGSNDPFSGYGKLILGESFIMTGNVLKGINLIKDGWITADLSRANMKHFRKKYKKYLNSNDYIKRADYLA